MGYAKQHLNKLRLANEIQLLFGYPHLQLMKIPLIFLLKTQTIYLLYVEFDNNKLNQNGTIIHLDNLITRGLRELKEKLF